MELRDLNPRVINTEDLESSPLDRSGKLTQYKYFHFFNIKYDKNIIIINNIKD